MAHDARAMPLFRNLLCAQDTAGCFRYTGECALVRGVLLKRNQHEQEARPETTGSWQIVFWLTQSSQITKHAA